MKTHTILFDEPKHLYAWLKENLPSYQIVGNMVFADGLRMELGYNLKSITMYLEGK